MKGFQHKANWIILALALACFVLYGLSQIRTSNQQIQEQEAFKQAVSFIESTKSDGIKLAKILVQKKGEVSTMLKLTSSGPWRACMFERDSMIFWSDNEWEADSTVQAIDSFSLNRDENGINFNLMHTEFGVHVYLNMPIQGNGIGSFSAFNSIESLKNWDYDIGKDSTNYLLPYSNLYIQFYSQESERGPSFLYILGLLLLLILFILTFKSQKLLALLAGMSVLLLRYLSYKGIFFVGINHFKVFDPLLFANNRGLPSLGDLALHITVAFVIVYAVLFGVSSVKRISNLKPFQAYLLFFLVCVVGFFLSDLGFSVVRSLVLDSNISFDVTHLNTMNLIGIFSFLLIGIMFWLLHDLMKGLLTSLSLTIKSWSIPLCAILAGIAFYWFQHLDASRSFSSLMPSMLFSFFTVLLFRWGHRLKVVFRTLIYLGLFALFFSSIVFKYQNQREDEYLKIYASKLIANKDLQAEYLFAEIEKKLVEEFLMPEDFNSFADRKDQFEKRLKRLYFSGYLDKYDMKVVSFDSLGTNINSSTLYNFQDLNEIYNFNSFPTISNHFYQIKSSEIVNGYLAKFENCDINGHYGNIFLLLEPKFIQSTYTYPTLVNQKTDKRLFELDDYSYAIYSGGKLMNQKGYYSYNLQLDSAALLVQNSFWNWRGFRHFVKGQGEEMFVVLSLKNNRLIAALSIFTFSYIFFVLVLIIIFGFRYLIERIIYWFILKRRNEEEALNYKIECGKFWTEVGFDQLYLSTRIRFAMVALVILGLLISLYVTVQFIGVNDSTQARSDLMYKIREVAGMAQNEVDLDRKLEEDEARQLIVNEISDIYKVEANIFKYNGDLLATSELQLYEKKVLAPLMDAEAFYQMKILKRSQYIGKEKIRDFEFLSAYVPLLNDNRSVIAYLNLPYFSREGDLEEKISAYIVTFVNLYFFLIILALGLAYLVSQRISKPLKLIRDKMSNTGFGHSNEMIEWKRQDEIGQLVKQYNKMVLELEESALKLSQSEREGAWKEMARQVAHEIKNPLTPMKLNIQHLQRAWMNKSDKLDETIERVSRVIIEQIDSLSKLATEFSSFAQMPTDQIEACDLTDILLGNIHLFEKTENVAFVYPNDLPKCVVLADQDQLRRVFNNVIKNAIQAIPEEKKGIIKISLEKGEEDVLVVIKDNGSGIDASQRDKIFVPNFSTKTSGMGLGLAITRKMVETSGGEIWFESAVNKGTRFFIKIPLYKSNDE